MPAGIYRYNSSVRPIEGEYQSSKLPRACRASIQTVDPNDLAAGAPARQQIDERLGQLIEAVPVLLDDAKSTLPDPLPELLKRFVPLLLGIFEDAESLQSRALPHHAHQIIACAPTVLVQHRNAAAHRDAATLGQVFEATIEHLALHVVEIDIDAFGTGVPKLQGEVGRGSIDTCVESQIFDKLPDLAFPAGNTDDARTANPRDLTRNRSYRSGCSGHDHGLARFWLRDIHDSEIRGEPIAAQDAQRQAGI